MKKRKRQRSRGRQKSSLKCRRPLAPKSRQPGSGGMISCAPQLIEIGVFGDEIVERDRFSGSLAQGGTFAHLVATQLGPLQARAPAPAS
jgi:hypothetical protein